MVKTRRGLNTSGKATKGNKKGVVPSDDTCMDVEYLIVNQEVQKAKRQKSTIKGKGSKTHVFTSMEDDQVFCPTPIRSLPPFNATYGVVHGEIPKVHNNYLPWVDYTNVRELDNPSMLCNILASQKEDILTTDDVKGLSPGFITISRKLMQGTHVADIPLVTTDIGGAS
ncbi:hypothetical protein LIER_36126 [Lithospermum erythrorhizon]|uniref:Uncharacterized protein n=1 Tax=Lithospermum erythrorhizon TaxID=34254 RepID=A0AAV3P2Z5_LITER